MVRGYQAQPPEALVQPLASKETLRVVQVIVARQCAESIDPWDLADFLFRHFKIDRKTLGSVPFLHQVTIEGAGCLVDAVGYWVTTHAEVWVAAWLLYRYGCLPRKVLQMHMKSAQGVSRCFHLPCS
jgi:hypothetical protein